MSYSVQSVSSRVELTGILINVWDNSITFEGRNDYIDTKIEENDLSTIRIIEPGKALLKASTLNEIVQKMTGEKVEFTKIDSNILILKSFDSKYDLNLLTDENFERAVFLNNFKNELTIPGNKFKESINKVVFAGQEYHPKFIYQGLNIVINEGKLITSVCDGIRIASYSTTISENINISKIIPLKVVKELIKILPQQEDYKFSFSENKGLVVTKNMIIQFSMIEGTYPSFEKLFDENIYDKKITLSKDILNNSIDRAIILNINKFDSSNKIAMLVNKNEFYIESRQQQIGSAKIIIENFEYESSESIKISLSSKFLSEGLRSFDKDEIEIYLKNSESYIYIKEKGNSKIKYLLSPMI